MFNAQRIKKGNNYATKPKDTFSNQICYSVNI